MARFFAEATSRVCVFVERGVVRFFARAAPALAAVVRRVVDFRPRAVRLFVRDAAAPPAFLGGPCAFRMAPMPPYPALGPAEPEPRFERDLVVLDFLPGRDFVPCLRAMDNLRGGRIGIGRITI